MGWADIVWGAGYTVDLKTMMLRCAFMGEFITILQGSKIEVE